MRGRFHGAGKGLRERVRDRVPLRIRNVVGRVRRDAGYTLGLLRTLKVAPVFDPRVEVRVEGRCGDLAPFLAGTQSGLLYVHEGRAWRLCGGSVYGIADQDGPREWMIFQRIPRSFGRILTIDLSSGEALAVAGFLSTGVHQMDRVNGRLAVIDTYNNRVSLYDSRGKCVRSIYPCGPVQNGRDSANYRHFNSIFTAGGSIYLVAHNQTAKTGRASEIFVLDPDWRFRRKIPTKSGSAHNVVELQGKLWHCDSGGGGLVVGDEPVYRMPGLFTRGLAVNRDYVLVGGSQLAGRDDREATDGQVIVLSRSLELRARIRLLRSGGVQEIRFLEGDLCMSRSRGGAQRDPS